MHFQYITYVWALIGSATVAGLLGLRAWRRHSVPGSTPFAVLMLSATLLALTNALEMAGTDLPTKLFWANVQYVWYGSIPASILLLAVEYSGHALRARRWLWLLLEPAATVLLVWSNPWHGLMRRNVYLDSTGSFPVIAKTYGPWALFHFAYSYILIVAAAILLLRMLPRLLPLGRHQTAALLIGLAMPLAWNVLYIAGLSPIPRHDLSPAVIGLAGLPIAWGLYRYRLFDIVPLARDLVIRNMADGAVVLDAAGHIADLNRAGEAILGATLSGAVGRHCRDVLFNWPPLVTVCEECSEAPRTLRDLTCDGRFFDLEISPLTDNARQYIGQVILFHDVTEHKHHEASLRKSKERLQLLTRRLSEAQENERRHVARELHDEAGQGLTALLLGLGALKEDGDAALTTRVEELTQVAEGVMEGLHRLAVNLRPASLDRRGLQAAVEQLVQSFMSTTGIGAALATTNFENHRLPADLEITLYRFVQEALTNVAKYAGASEVQVLLHLETEAVVALVEDDGVGFDPDRLPEGEHLGLLGIRERVEALNGELTIESAPGRGTTLHVEIPLAFAGNDGERLSHARASP